MTRLARREGMSIDAYSEAEWGRQVDELLDMYGWDYRYHVVRSKFTPWGWPDRVAIRRKDRRLLFVELKKAGGKPTPDQVGVLELLLDISEGGWQQQHEVIGHPGAVTALAKGWVRVDVELWEPGDVDRVMAVLR